MSLDDPEVETLLGQKWQMRDSCWKRSSCWTEQVRNLIMELVSKGELSPVFFGSALTNFGVETFLEHFLNNDNISASEKV